MKMTKEMIKEDIDVIKAEKFKRYFWDLIEKSEYTKALHFRDFVYRYLERKGKKSEYVFIMEPTCKSINDLTDEMMNSWY